MKFREEKNLGREVGEEREMEVGIRKGTGEIIDRNFQERRLGGRNGETESRRQKAEGMEGWR